jgi:hypothetical protein
MTEKRTSTRKTTAAQSLKRDYVRTHDAEFEYLHISERADYRALQTEVLAYLENIKQKRSRREIYAKMSKLRLVREALLHSYLEDILFNAVRDGILVKKGSVLIPKWKVKTDDDDGVKVFTAEEIKKIDHRTTNSQLFGKVARQVNPFAESVYSKV